MSAQTKMIRKFIGKKKWLYAAGIIILAAVVGYGYSASHHKSNPPVSNTSSQSSKIDYSPATKADNQPNNNRKGSSNPTSTLNNYQSPPNTGNFSVTVSRANVSNGSLQVAVLINGVTDGTCTLDVHQSGQPTVSKTEDIVLQVNSYVCPVFNIPTSQFPNQGSWYVSVTVTSSGKTVSADWAKNPVSLS